MINTPLQNESIFETVSVNTRCKISSLTIGEEGNLIVIVDDFLLNSDELIMMAEGQGVFVDEADNYYPGQRADIPQLYSQALAVFFKESIAPLFTAPNHTAPEVIESKFCIATKAPTELNLIILQVILRLLKGWQRLSSKKIVSFFTKAMCYMRVILTPKLTYIQVQQLAV